MHDWVVEAGCMKRVLDAASEYFGRDMDKGDKNRSRRYDDGNKKGTQT